MPVDLDDYTDDDCWRCHGRGVVLARLTQEQDFGFAQRGAPIPKVQCPRCKGTGLNPKS